MDLNNYSSEQVISMKEECIVVDEGDVAQRPESKLTCMACCTNESYLLGHLISGKQLGVLHRAFSVFQFDTQDRLYAIVIITVIPGYCNAEREGRLHFLQYGAIHVVHIHCMCTMNCNRYEMMVTIIYDVMT